METDSVEADLRQALSRRAAEVPGEAIERLRHQHYRPRTAGRAKIAGVGLAGAAVAVLAITVAYSGSAPGSSPAKAQLAAWSVARQANGDVYVTVSELSDPAGLQSTLRADGVPASVTFLGQQDPACSLSPQDTNPGLLGRIFPVTGETGKAQHLPGGTNVSTGGRPTGRDLVIDPSAIPTGVGLQLAWTRIGKLVLGRQDLVQASPQCTGS